MIYEVLINTDVEKAILFGSYAKNTPTSKSDIDLFEISEIQEGSRIYNDIQNYVTQVGELVKEITDDTMKKYSNIPWNSIKGIRNRIVHDYENVDLSVLWATIKESLPILRDNLKDIILGDTDILF